MNKQASSYLLRWTRTPRNGVCFGELAGAWFTTSRAFIGVIGQLATVAPNTDLAESSEIQRH